MNKEQLVNAIYEQCNFVYTKRTIKDILDGFLKVTINTVAEGDKVTLVGFGSFDAIYRNERKGINVKTQEKIDIPATYYPKFKAGKDFKEAVAKLIN